MIKCRRLNLRLLKRKQVKKVSNNFEGFKLYKTCPYLAWYIYRLTLNSARAVAIRWCISLPVTLVTSHDMIGRVFAEDRLCLRRLRIFRAIRSEGVLMYRFVILPKTYCASFKRSRSLVGFCFKQSEDVSVPANRAFGAFAF